MIKIRPAIIAAALGLGALTNAFAPVAYADSADAAVTEAAPETTTKAPEAQGTRPCPSYWYCFYQNRDYNRDVSGWKLNYNTTPDGTFNHPPSSGQGDIRNQLSSIINNGNRTVCVHDERIFGSDPAIIRVAPYQDYTYVGDGANDRADYWIVRPGNSNCPNVQ